MKNYLPGEEWRDVVGFEGFYEISSLGRVYGVPRRDIRNVPRGGKMRKVGIDPSNGYPSVHLRMPGISRNRTVHSLILQAFRGPCPPGEEGCHEDDIRSNSVLSNLRWDSRRGNSEDRDRNGRTARGSKNGFSILTEPQVAEIKRRLARGDVGAQIAREFGVHKSTIYNIKRERDWKHIDAA